MRHDNLKVGAQLYTVRDFCKDLDGFALTLKKIADIGYKYVQVSGTCEFAPEWLKSELEKNGLECVLTHTPADKLLGDPAAVAAEHDVFGCKYVGLGWNAYKLAEGDTPEAFYEKYINTARVLKSCGKYFMYHNHDQEFQRHNGKLVLEHMAESFAPDEMGFTLDTFWVTAGGGDPAQWIERLAGRVPCIHLKDFAYGRKMSVVGEGNINFDRVFQCAEAAGTEYMLVEQDDCNGEDPFDCLKRSYEYLKACGFDS
jgi:sugar phosphate isomerase/epimerase